MPKSYKITTIRTFASEAFASSPQNFTRQMSLDGMVPGPETVVSQSSTVVNVGDYIPYNIDHEYTVNMHGRSYQDGTTFSRFIAKGRIIGYWSARDSQMLLSGKKSDILDFCKSTECIPEIKLAVLQVDMDALQDKLSEVKGVWFRSRAGYIRARGYMGNNIQDTSEYKAARNQGSISTLSFYFEDARSGTPHPIMITEDGTVVLQKNYRNTDEEIDFVLYAKTELLDGITQITDVGRSKVPINGCLTG